MIGANPRLEAAVLNARIRKRWRIGNFPIGVIGEKADLTYNYDYLGAGPETLAEVLGRTHRFADTLKKAERPLVIVGAGALARSDGAAVAALAAKAAIEVGAVKAGLEWLLVLHNAASRVGGLDLGFVPGAGGMTAAQMAADGRARRAVPARRRRDRDRGIGRFRRLSSAPMATAARIAPTSSCRARPIPEKSGLYVNTEGRVQMAERAAFPPGDAREDWAILRALSDVLGHKLPYDSLCAVARGAVQAHPHLAQLDRIAAGRSLATSRSWAALGGTPDKAPFVPALEDFYLTNPIARASAVMAECSAIAEGNAALTAAE